MASIPWKELLERLPFSAEQKGRIFTRLVYGGGIEPIQDFFDVALKLGGEKALMCALQELIQGADVGLIKRVKIYSLHAEGEELFLKGRYYKVSSSTFESWMQTKFLVPFKGGKADEDADFISTFDELLDGESYVLEDSSGFHSRVKVLESYEEELGESMVRELKANGLAEDPVIRDDLRLHCKGTVDEPEFDAVVLDGDHQAFVGSSKHVAHGTSEVEAHSRSLRILNERANNTVRYASYVPFRGRRLGACMRIEKIKDAQQENVKHFCFRKGVGLFQRSGSALTMQPLSFRDPQLLDPGMINVIVRGFKRVAR